MKITNFILIGFILSLFLISFASATCTVTFTKTTHVEGETVTANLICSENGEKNTAYTLNWTNSSGYQLELDTGTTPSVRNTLFAQTYLIPSGYVANYGDTLNATLQGTGLEGTDSMTISVPASGNLIIKNISITNIISITLRAVRLRSGVPARIRKSLEHRGKNEKNPKNPKNRQKGGPPLKPPETLGYPPGGGYPPPASLSKAD